MTQIAQFLLVVVGVAVAALWALLRKRSGRWFLLIMGAFVAWLVLPSVILQVKWGYYEENGAAMASDKWNIYKARSANGGGQARRLAAEVCGDAEDFEVKDPSLQLAMMPEHAVVEHFLRLSKYSNVFWVGVGWKDRYCLARYLVTNVKDIDFSPLPTQLFPYPFFPWTSFSTEVEQRFLERLKILPKARGGGQVLLPGQCLTGVIGNGDHLQFQVEMPYYNQGIKLLFRDRDCGQKDHPLLIEWSKSGQHIQGTTDGSGSAGTYEIDLRSTASESRHYQLALYWGTDPWCGFIEWRQGCPDTDLERYRESLEHDDR
jgi:hypothetical protein